MAKVSNTYYSSIYDETHVAGTFVDQFGREQQASDQPGLVHTVRSNANAGAGFGLRREDGSAEAHNIVRRSVFIDYENLETRYILIGCTSVRRIFLRTLVF